MDSLHPILTTNTYADVVLPLSVPKPYTYAVPEALINQIAFGVRVEVPFGGKKLYSGLVVEVHHKKPVHPVKSVLSIIDDKPLINHKTILFWNWLSDYYVCSLGEVMEAALPTNLKLASERRIVISPLFDGNLEGLDDKEYIITEALIHRATLSIDDIRNLLNQKTVLRVIKSLLDKKVIYLHEEMQEKYTPKKVACVRLAEPYRSDQNQLDVAFELCGRAAKQTEALLAYVQISRELTGSPSLASMKGVLRQDIYKKANADSTVLAAMAKKGIFELFERTVSRIGDYDEELDELEELSDQQKTALIEIRSCFKDKNTVLLQGVTGSGKTRVYLELMQETLSQGKQVLYLLPEVALTTQIIGRLQKNLGNQIGVYHHRITNNERVEIWQAVQNSGLNLYTQKTNHEVKAECIVGARSALLLPFSNLGLIIVDEEHDTSYKQRDPAPRYNGRDAAVYLANLHNAKVVLGTATPSIESYQNTQSGKYGLVQMSERFGGIQLPQIEVVDVKDELKKQKLQSHFTSVLLEELQSALTRGEQAILFQNRRGYSPTLRCHTCGWHSQCVHCDVSLTFHKFKNNLQCHYCGYQMSLAKNCPACGSIELKLEGFGTEKIEDEIKIYLPDANIGRLDYDAVRTKDAHSKIINDFEEKRIDILVGTQMVTKGLDFENVGVVGVLSADQLLQFPDFRSGERGFQMMTQVAGRAGRKNKQGKVIIQASNTTHPVLKEVIDNDFHSFYNREIMERKSFHYPPFSRLIGITLKHKKPDMLNKGATIFGTYLKNKLGARVLGPCVPPIGRVRGLYLIDILLKLEMKPAIWKFAKEHVLEASRISLQEQGLSGLKISVDVDPI